MIKNKKSNLNRNTGIMPIVYIVLFCTLTFALFSYKFFTFESVDSNKQWCPTHNTYHDINDESIDNEIWCKNCQKWHAPNQESQNRIK